MRDQQNLEATTSPRSLVGIIHNLSLFTSNPQLPTSSLAPLKPAYQSLCLSDARPSIRCYFRWHPQSHIRANSILHLPTASHMTCEPNSLPDSDFRGSRLSSLQKTCHFWAFRLILPTSLQLRQQSNFSHLVAPAFRPERLAGVDYDVKSVSSHTQD